VLKRRIREPRDWSAVTSVQAQSRSSGSCGGNENRKVVGGVVNELREFWNFERGKRTEQQADNYDESELKAHRSNQLHDPHTLPEMSNEFNCSDFETLQGLRAAWRQGLTAEMVGGRKPGAAGELAGRYAFAPFELGEI
jgi:hypothetical protein